MGWFDEQIRERIKYDNDNFADAMAGIAAVVMGEKIAEALNEDRFITKNAIEEILKYYHTRPRELPDNITGMNDQLEYLLRPTGIMYRNIILDGEWYNEAIGAILGIRKEDGTAVALIPCKFSGYKFFDTNKGKMVKVNKDNAYMFDDEAICFYRPLPMGSIGIKDLIAYMIKSVTIYDLMPVIVSAMALTLVGMLLPKLNNIIYNYIIPSKTMQLLVAVMVFMLCVNLSQVLINAIKTLFVNKIATKITVQVQAAMMMRVFSLSPKFFKEFSSGNLSLRMSYMEELCTFLSDLFFSTGMTSLFYLAYLVQMAKYGPGLFIPALVVILFTVVFSLCSGYAQMRDMEKAMELLAKESGMNHALIEGMQKIKLAGAEKRAFSRWARLYQKAADLVYNPPVVEKYNSFISSFIGTLATIVIYYFTITTDVALADYFAFNTAFGVVMGAFSTLLMMVTSFARIKPIIKLMVPILEAEPEVSENKKMVTKLSGGIELNNISFRYNDGMPWVLDDLSLKIRHGQYVAIVGETGCGKSTLLKILLGFETAQKGAVYYDGKDINSLDLKSLRSHIGTVMQDGKLFQGDIFSNITISAPHLTMDDAWRAAEISGMDEDICNMPMGMSTIISEGTGGISGGQRQRLLIARAIAPNPKILMFDEATSALDNITQKKVSDSLSNLKCTRIVVAHRLSTIKNCDRIIVLDKGKIIEDGKYDELINKNGFFTELVARQQIESNVIKKH